MDIHFFNQQQDLPVIPQQVESVVKEVLTSEGIHCDEVAVHFVTSSAMCDLHRLYFNDPSPTDCISFPIDPEGKGGYKVLGEVFVCPRTAIEYSQTHAGDPFEETTLYIVHGLLHLMGYDDIAENEEPKMRQAEARLMERLKNKDLVLKGENCT